MPVTITYLQEATITYSDTDDVREAVERWEDGEREDSDPQASKITYIDVSGSDIEYKVSHAWNDDPVVTMEVKDGIQVVYPDPLKTIYEIGEKLAKLGYTWSAGTNFDLRISNEAAAKILRGRRIGLDLIPANMPLMCKEYGEDDDWCELTEDDLREDGTVDDDYKTIEIWAV